MLRQQTGTRGDATEGRVDQRSCDWKGMTPEHASHHPSDAGSMLLDAAAVADLLGAPTSWGYAEARAGRLPHVRVGRYRRFRRGALDAWVADHERGPVR